MSLAEFLGLFANLATAGAAFIALFALLEVKKQRTAAYRPDLAVVRSAFFWSGKVSAPSSFSEWRPNPPDGFDWSYEPPEEKQELTPALYAKSRKHLFTVGMVNLGLAAAKGIKVDWNWPIAEVISDINRLCIRHKVPVLLKRDRNMVELQDHNVSVNMIFNVQEIDFCLPISMNPGPTDLMVPMWYLYLMPLYFYLLLEDNEEIPQVPGLILKVDYFDIGGAKHTRRFNVDASVTFITRNPKTGRVSCRGVLESQPLGT